MSHGRRCCSVLLTVALLTACGPGHPSDADLRHRLSAQRPLFDSLRVLALSDRKLLRVTPDWYRLRDGGNQTLPSAILPERRWHVYRRLFSELGLDDGVSLDTGVVLFNVSDRGIVGSGSTKGLVYLERPNEGLPRCASLDTLPTFSRAGHGECYKLIDGGWFLYLDW